MPLHLEDAPPELTLIPEPTGKEKETRIKDAISGRALVGKLVQEDDSPSKRRATTKGLIDGNPPYGTERLRAAGLAWMTDLNLMEGKALMDSSGIPYYSLFAGAETHVEIETDFEPDHPDHQLWCGQIARRMHNMLKRWKQFDWNIQQASFWMRMHGIGPCIFERDDDWRFRALETGSVLVPRGTQSCIDNKVPYVIARMKYRAHELFGFIREEEAARNQGWDIEAVKATIRKSWTRGGLDSAAPWEELQRRLKNDDLNVSYVECDEISIAHIFANEYSGKTSHFILTEASLTSGTFDESKHLEGAFLYKHVARYDGLEQVMTVFFQDIGDGTWHSVRGLADLARKHLEVLNRLDCRMIDGAFIDGGIVLQPEGAKDIDKIQSIQWGPFTVLPAGLKMQQGRLGGQLEGTMAVSRTLRNGLANNIGMFNQRSVAREDGRGEAVTAEQIRAQVSKESTLNQGQMALAYITFDGLVHQMLRRSRNPSTTDKEALRFQRECEEDGVPKEALEQARARANRAAGFGSPQMAFMTLNQLMPIVPMLPEDGKNAFLDLFIQATAGAEKVRVLNPRHHIPSDDDAVAAMEALMFDAGREPVIAAGQNDVIHVQSHLADAQQKLGPLAEAIDAGDQLDEGAMQQAMVYVQPFIAHTQKHMARMKADPSRRQLIRQFEDQLKAAVAFDGKLRGELIRAQREAAIAAEEQENATALDATTAASLRATEAGIANDRAKTMAKIENDRLKVVNRAQLDRIKTKEEIVNAREKQPASNGNGSS